jgi:hypothetical protein
VPADYYTTSLGSLVIILSKLEHGCERTGPYLEQPDAAATEVL